MKLRFLSIAFFIFIATIGQNGSAWDNTQVSSWPKEFTQVAIPSSLDQEVQSAFFYAAQQENRPLVISLHSWSANFEQKDELALQCIQKDFNYIHPNFRGPNNTFKACGSEYVIQDIEDAIAFAIKHGKADPQNIHIVGSSGGGHATLLTYMKSKFSIKTFSAWVPISDIEQWYYQSEGRKNKYAYHIASATNKNNQFDKENYSLNKEEALRRSPIHMNTPAALRKKSKLFIYAGIHDGYTGSVPISQSLNFYNKVVLDFDSAEKEALIPQEDILEMVSSRNFVEEHKNTLGDREVHYKKTYKELLSVTIFEGTHECLTDIALDQVEPEKILAIGDSNGAHEFGWVHQLKALRFEKLIYNTSISGNTIGFDNNGQEKLNTLRNIDRYLNDAETTLHGLDKIAIMLGTNDSKAVFEKRNEEVITNLDKLLKKIKAHPIYLKHTPQIFVISPPPCGNDTIMKPKYHGAEKRVEWLVHEFEKITTSNECIYINVHDDLVSKWHEYAKDGIHPNIEGQKVLTKLIDALITVPE
jgi:lysophospholipase L1-like esterase/dienelactone hydrolase